MFECGDFTTVHKTIRRTSFRRFLKRGQLPGEAFIGGGILFLLRDLLELMAGPPPSSGVEILVWIASGRLTLALANEVLFFAAMSLVPAVIALYYSLAGIDRVKAAAGCGIIATVVPVIVVLDIVHGRLVYPVYGKSD